KVVSLLEAISGRLRHGAAQARGCRVALDFQKMAAIMLQFVDGFIDIGKRLMPRLLDEAPVDFRLPSERQLLQRADIQVAVVEESLECRHVLHEESAILADGIATHR